MRLNFNAVARAIMVTVFSLGAVSIFANCGAAVKNFYVAYMQNADQMKDGANIDLKQTYMTSAVLDKIAQETERTDADAVIMAQDVSQYGIKSLTVEELEDDWYVVMYNFSADSNETMIYIKACNCDGEFKIVDISWPGTDDNDNN